MMSPHIKNLHPNLLQLSPQMQRVLDFVDRELSEGRTFPAPAAIARFMGWKTADTAKDSLQKLRWRGLV